jgi:hypothetical protein
MSVRMKNPGKKNTFGSGLENFEDKGIMDPNRSATQLLAVRSCVLFRVADPHSFHPDPGL